MWATRTYGQRSERDHLVRLQRPVGQLRQGPDADTGNQRQLCQATRQGAGAAQLDGHTLIHQQFHQALQAVAAAVHLVGQTGHNGVGHQKQTKLGSIALPPDQRSS